VRRTGRGGSRDVRSAFRTQSSGCACQLSTACGSATPCWGRSGDRGCWRRADAGACRL